MTKKYADRWDAGCDSRPLLEEADRELERLRAALQKIVSEGDYTAPEGMKRIAQAAIFSESPATPIVEAALQKLSEKSPECSCNMANEPGAQQHASYCSLRTGEQR